MFVEAKDRFLQFFTSQIDTIKNKVFGVNNERLDFVIDSFYKLNPSQRNGLILGVVGGVSFVVCLVLFLFFSQVTSLKKELDESVFALRELEEAKLEEAQVSKNFEKLTNLISSKTKGFNVKPFFEKVSKDLKVDISGLNVRNVDMNPQNPLSDKMKEVQVELRISKVSIPRLLKFLTEVEKSNHFLRVQDMKITGLYGNKLFFDTNILVRGYITI